MIRLISRIVLIAWTLVLIGLLLPVDGGDVALNSFLKPQLWWLITSGAVIMALFIIFSFQQEHETPCHRKSLLGAAIKPCLLALPIPFILVYGNSEYGIDAVANRLTMRSKPQAGATGSLPVPKQSTIDSACNVDLMELTLDPGFYDGRSVKTIGMFYRGSEISRGYLFCFRYVMVCCAADAIPVGVLIKDSDTIPAGKNDWYEITGTVTQDSLDGYFVVKMNDALIKPIDKPRHTWLYPR